MSKFTQDHLLGVAKNFLMDGVLQSFETHGNGNVNDTFLLYYHSEDCVNRYTLQRINHEVFKNPEGLMENFSRVTRHLQAKFANDQTNSQSLSLISAKDGKSFHKDSGGNYWRVTKFIDGGRSFEVPEDLNQAYHAAKSFGEFQFQLLDLPGEPLIETIADFHNTKLRFDHFCSVVKENQMQRVDQVSDLIDFALSRENLAKIISGDDFPTRTVHNDTKLNNVLLHKTSGEGMCVVDLDTVMPGCVLHDFGDLVRTAASSGLEDEQDLDKVYFLPSTFEAITKGYLDTAGDMLNANELEHLAVAPLVITYELGLRFLEDFLKGDQYFKIKHPEHNIDRVRAQFKLLTSMEENLQEMKRIVQLVSSPQVSV